jgi:hypothetical protein
VLSATNLVERIGEKPFFMSDKIVFYLQNIASKIEKLQEENILAAEKEEENMFVEDKCYQSK